MPSMKYNLLKRGEELEFVEMPATHAYQLSALNRRLHKEIDKLTAGSKPQLAVIVAECSDLELIDPQYRVQSGLEYVRQLEQAFSALDEKTYPLISLLTEIRALLAQLEEWYEEEAGND